MPVLVPPFEELQDRRNRPERWLRQIFESTDESTFGAHTLISLLKPWTSQTSHIALTYLTKRVLLYTQFVPSEAAAQRAAQECFTRYELDSEEGQEYALGKITKMLVGTQKDLQISSRHLILPVDVMLASHFIAETFDRLDQDLIISDTVSYVESPEWEEYTIKSEPNEGQLKVGVAEMLASWSQRKYLAAAAVANKVFTDYDSDYFVEPVRFLTRQMFREFHQNNFEDVFDIIENFVRDLEGAPDWEDPQEICSQILGWIVMGDDPNEAIESNLEKALFYALGMLSVIFQMGQYSTEQMVKSVLQQL